ncbi:MAG: hypothetical protein WCL27_02295 [Betaproteobacteria bacterium]
MKKNAIVLAILVMLSGCGKEGVGVSTEGSSGSSVETKSGLSWLKEISTGSSAKNTIAMPASALIADAMNDIMATFDIKAKDALKNFFEMADYEGWTPVKTASTWTFKPSYDWAAYKQRLLERKSAARSIATTNALIKCVDMGVKGDLEAAQTCYNDIYMRVWAAAAIAVAVKPEQGWPVDPDGKKAAQYMFSMSSIVEFSSLLGSELASKLQGRVLRDPADAKEQIAAALLAIPREKLNAISNASTEIVDKGFKENITIDMASGKGITWTLGNGNYKNMGAGWSLSRNGVTWFGEGKLCGKSYDLALESSISATRTTRDQTDQSVGTSSQSSTKGNVGVK